MNIHLATLGCKLNESEIQAWARQLARAGHVLVNDVHAADVIVLNTCTITHVAARKTRQLARQFARVNPHARLVLTGCFVTISPDEARALPNVALIVPNADKDRLPLQIADLRLPVENEHTRQSAIENLKSRTRAFVKIQDGCNFACAYCIIPRARGAERSRPRDEIVAEVRALVDAGYKEIVLTGVQISSYRDRGANFQFALHDVVAAILAETNVPRLRLTSLAPWDVDDALLEVWRDARVCRHIHLSLQSGCDATLRRMRRPYTTAQFARAVERVRAKIPDVGITTDVIVGFPGETDAEFQASLRFVERVHFSRVHVFPYSRRAGTPAATFPDQVPDAVKQARARQMQAIADASQRAFAQRFVGRELMVLWESGDEGRMTDDEGRVAEDEGRMTKDEERRTVWSGYSDNYIRVVTTSARDLHNQLTRAHVIGITDEGVVATV
jgi:threonylcarbamoyladenosine tRNA methylthiotransferase MtaB